MTVSELIEFLQQQPQQPQELQVAYGLYSEQCLLEVGNIKIEVLSAPRGDGWVPNNRPDKEAQAYLVFPGN